MRPTLELLDLLDQVRELMRVELSLVRAEISERTSGIPSSLTAVVVGIVLLPVALGLILVAVSLFLLRFGIPSLAAPNSDGRGERLTYTSFVGFLRLRSGHSTCPRP
jgi:hypothetical protein